METNPIDDGCSLLVVDNQGASTALFAVGTCMDNIVCTAPEKETTMLCKFLTKDSANGIESI
jgi:hypothetical protein